MQDKLTHAIKVRITEADFTRLHELSRRKKRDLIEAIRELITKKVRA